MSSWELAMCVLQCRTKLALGFPALLSLIESFPYVCIFRMQRVSLIELGTAWNPTINLLRHYATSGKVTVSRPDEVN
jgi:hypothetical protein